MEQTIQRSTPHQMTPPTHQQKGIISEKDRQTLSNALGWFSLGLGIVQVLMPGRLAELIGFRNSHETRLMMRAIGLRELASGIGILGQLSRMSWVRARVAGDLMDLAILGTALASDDTEREKTAFTTASVVGVTMLDMLCSLDSQKDSTVERHPNATHVRKSITINREPEEIYRYWRDFENLPRFMSHLESVQSLGMGRSHWKTKGPIGKTVEWDAEIIEDIPNELIAWRSLEGSEVYNAGLVHFKTASKGRGTEVHVEMHYEPPAGKLGVIVAKLFGEDAEQQIYDDLRAFKQVMETGEIVQAEGTIQGQRYSQRPAQPHESNGRMS